ncbi:MAG: transposase [Desulfobacterales bacterium]|nr:transposase [Desulfobacterales bacterium]
MIPSRPQRKNLRLESFNYNNPSYVYFLTLCARHLPAAPFQNPAIAEGVVNSLAYIRDAKRGNIYCYCLMPDHLHLALSPLLDLGVSDIVRQLKSYTTRFAWNFGIRGRLWQKSFYDHIARKDEDLVGICEYILANPVRKGLVRSADQWQYCGLWAPLPI